MAQFRYQRITTGYSETTFRWLTSYLDTLREHRSARNNPSITVTKTEVDLKWAWHMLILSSVYQTLITLPIQEESGCPDESSIPTTYLFLTYHKLVDHLHWSLKALTHSDLLLDPEQIDSLARTEWIIHLTHALGDLKPRRYVPHGPDRLFLFHESGVPTPETGRALPIIWYYTSFLSTLVSGYQILMDIGTAWAEITSDSTPAQIEDICLSLSPLLRSYVNWKRAVRGTSALWYPFTMSRTFPIFEIETYLVNSLHTMDTLCELCSSWVRTEDKADEAKDLGFDPGKLSSSQRPAV
eukprot:gene10202-21265_t